MNSSQSTINYKSFSDIFWIFTPIVTILLKLLSIKNFSYNQWNSETLELSSLTESNRNKREFAKSKLFQYFDVFSSSIRLNRTRKIIVLLHFNDFLWVMNEFGWIWIDSFWFGSIRYSRKVPEFHNFWMKIYRIYGPYFWL